MATERLRVNVVKEMPHARCALNSREVELAMELIRGINKGGITLLVIEHVMKAIMGISDRLIVLHFGKKIAEGNPQEIVQIPEVVQAYLGERFAKRELERQGRKRP